MTQTKIGTTTNTPRGWGALISQLLSAPDQRSFHHGMLDLQCKIVAAEYGAMWAPGPDGQLQMVDAWPEGAAANSNEAAVFDLLKEAAKGGFERGVSQVLKVETEGNADPDGIGAHVFVTALRVEGNVVGATTVVADCRDASVIQSTSPMRELAAGLFEGFYAKQEAKKSQTDADQVRNAMALLATSQDAEGFYGASMNLVNELARQLKCARVSMGWVKGQKVKLVAMSDTEQLKRHSHGVGLLELAMAETLDQQHPVLIPPPTDEEAEPLLAQAVTHAHRTLVDDAKTPYVLSIPLRMGDEWLGVITLERPSDPFPLELVSQLQLIADVLATHLADRFDTDRWLVGHAWNSVQWVASYMVGPKHVGWKLLGVAVSALLIASFLISMPARVAADFVLDAETNRVIPSPFEGTLADSLVMPGDIVTAGQPLAKLDIRERFLELDDIKAQRQSSWLEYQRSVAAGTTGDPKEIAESHKSRARLQELDAQIALLNYEIERSTIRSPIAGVVLEGKWYDKVGGVIERGQVMFQVATLEDLMPVLRVREDDVDMIHTYFAHTGTMPEGYLATRSEPSQKFRFTVDRVIPTASIHENRNIFEVQGKLDLQPWTAETEFKEHALTLHDGRLYYAAGPTGPSTRRGAIEPTPEVEDGVWQRADWLRPRMEGTARVQVEERTLAWMATHQLVDFVRLWFWW